MTPTLARDVTGGLSNPSKMPGKAFGLPAAGEACPIGAKLAAVPGSVCHGCYATKGMYGFPIVREAQARRFAAVKLALSDPSERAKWVDAMATQIRREQYFRWHDSGDIFSLEYLEMIVDVVKATPDTKHWLPTRELMTVRRYQLRHGAFPENLVVRLSLPMVNPAESQILAMARAFQLPLSAVSTQGFTCSAPTNGNACGNCRKCWSPNVGLVTYRKH